MSILLKALGILFTAAIFSVVLKPKNAEISFLISLCAVLTVGIYVIISVWDYVEKIRGELENHNVNTEYFKVALKALFIAYISETVSDTCKDFGQTALANKAELAGKCVVFMLTVPIFCDILEISLSFLKI